MGLLTLWVCHPLHGCGGNHDGHGDFESQHCGAEVDAGDIDENSWTKPAIPTPMSISLNSMLNQLSLNAMT